MKVCTKCGVEKDEADFYKRSGRGDGAASISAWCKACHRVYVSRYMRDTRIKNPETARLRDRHYYAKAKPCRRGQNLKRSYGLTEEQYAGMLQAQNGVCAICKNRCKTGRRLAVDHIHGTEPAVIRGLLCTNCNLAIGNFKDSPELCEAGAAFLRMFS